MIEVVGATAQKIRVTIVKGKMEEEGDSGEESEDTLRRRLFHNHPRNYSKYLNYTHWQDEDFDV